MTASCTVIIHALVSVSLSSFRAKPGTEGAWLRGACPWTLSLERVNEPTRHSDAFLGRGQGKRLSVLIDWFCFEKNAVMLSSYVTILIRYAYRTCSKLCLWHVHVLGLFVHEFLLWLMTDMMSSPLICANVMICTRGFLVNKTSTTSSLCVAIVRRASQPHWWLKSY